MNPGLCQLLKFGVRQKAGSRHRASLKKLAAGDQLSRKEELLGSGPRPVLLLELAGSAASRALLRRKTSVPRCGASELALPSTPEASRPSSLPAQQLLSTDNLHLRRDRNK